MSGADPRHDELPEQVLRDEGARWRQSRAGCPDPDLLMVYDSELLDPDVRSALDEHLRGCTACARLSADLGALRSEGEAATEAAVLERVRHGGPSSSRWRLPVAAALLIGCGAAIWWMSRAPTPSASTTHVALPNRPSGSAGPVALWNIDPLPVTIPLSSVGATRSASANDAAAGLADALAPYQAGHYDEAIPALGAVTRAHPDSADAALYLGVSYLLANRPGDAVAPLERARLIAGTRHSAEIDWYLAAAEQRTGLLAAAHDRLRTLCAAPGLYQQRACTAEQALR